MLRKADVAGKVMLFGTKPAIALVSATPSALLIRVAFEFNKDAYNAKQFGLWSHTSVRKDKFDCFPQKELVKMLKNFYKENAKI